MSALPPHDHKRIAARFALTASAFLAVGFVLVLLLRWQLAYPGSPLPFAAFGLARVAGEAMPGGLITPELYNQLGAMHGTIMIFLAVVPLSVGGFGTWLVPPMIGARDMTFPRLTSLSYRSYVAAGLLMLASFFLPGGAAANGWTSYPPLAVVSLASGQTLWLAGMILLGVSSAAGAINTIVTIVQARAPGMKFMRMPYFVWTQLVTAFLLLLAFPPLQAAAAMQLMDRLAGSSFFMPSGLVVNGVAAPYAGGGNPLLWQHLFWFLAHPEVYVLILPALGIVAEVLASNTGRPLRGYRLMVGSAIFLGFASMLVWAHHMFLTGMGTTMSAFFQTTTMIVSIPSVLILTALVLSLHGGSIRFATPMLFALAFLPMFGLGGLTGLPLGLAASDIHLHDTYYVVGHFHYIVAPGTLFALFAGVYHWFPRWTGRTLDDTLGRLHFWGSLVCMNLVFFPMFLQGLAGLNRRLYDGGISYAHGAAIQHWNVVQGWSAWALGLFQLIFLFNLVRTLRQPAAAGANPWQAATLEWSETAPAAAAPGSTFELRRDTGLSSVQLATWLFIASTLMLFAGMISAYVLLRAGTVWPPYSLWFAPAMVSAVVLALSSICMHAAAVASGRSTPHARAFVLMAAALAIVFLVVKILEGSSYVLAGHRPASANLWAIWHLLTITHAAFLAAAAAVAVWFAIRSARVVDRFAAGARPLAACWHVLTAIGLILFVAIYR